MTGGRAVIEAALREKIAELERRSEALAGGERLRDTRHLGECEGWIAEALNVIEFAVPLENNPYRRRAKAIGEGSGAALPKVTSLGAMLGGLLSDMDKGLIADFGNRIRAETFDDFLDHADAYREGGEKQAAGVLAGVVFEDTIRRICRDKGIAEKGEELDQLISALAKQTVITGQQTRQARTAAFVRTKATHAQWDEYDLDGVAQTITLTRALLREHLDG
jgi:hypothetical protein